MASPLDSLAPQGTVDITVIEDKSSWYGGRQTCGQPACAPKPVCVKPCPEPPKPVCKTVVQEICEIPCTPPPPKVCVTETVTTCETKTCSGPSDDSWGSSRNYTALFWFLWLILAPVAIYIILLSFPGRFILVQDPITGNCVVDYRRLFGISLLTGWFLTLLIWIASWSCY